MSAARIAVFLAMVASAVLMPRADAKVVAAAATAMPKKKAGATAATVPAAPAAGTPAPATGGGAGHSGEPVTRPNRWRREGCPLDQFFDAATEQCTACDHMSCPDDAFRVGKCKGATNGYRCQLLRVEGSTDAPAPAAAYVDHTVNGTHENATNKDGSAPGGNGTADPRKLVVGGW